MNFFVSRAGEDSECAQWTAKLLQAEGHTVTLQDFDFKGSFVDCIRDGLESAECVIAILSPHYLAKEFTTRELYSAVAGGLPIIPVRVAPCEIPHPIKDYICMEFVGKTEEQRKRVLLDTIQRFAAVERKRISPKSVVEPNRTRILKRTRSDWNGRDRPYDAALAGTIERARLQRVMGLPQA